MRATSARYSYLNFAISESKPVSVSDDSAPSLTAVPLFDGCSGFGFDRFADCRPVQRGDGYGVDPETATSDVKQRWCNHPGDFPFPNDSILFAARNEQGNEFTKKRQMPDDHYVASGLFERFFRCRSVLKRGSRIYLVNSAAFSTVCCVLWHHRRPPARERAPRPSAMRCNPKTQSLPRGGRASLRAVEERTLS
jgi:hypothetical protein